MQQTCFHSCGAHAQTPHLCSYFTSRSEAEVLGQVYTTSFVSTVMTVRGVVYCLANTVLPAKPLESTQLCQHKAASVDTGNVVQGDGVTMPIENLLSIGYASIATLAKNL